MTSRERLPNRRRSENFPVDLPGNNRQIVMTVGYYPDDRVAECFISDVKAGSDQDAITRDAAVLLSLALQYHIPLEVIQGAVTRDLDGEPSTVVGVLVDKLIKEQS